MCPWICQRHCDRHSDLISRRVGSAGLTLSDESLAGVQQNVTAFHDHPLNGEVFPYVLCLTDFIVHHSVRHSGDRREEETGVTALPQAKTATRDAARNVNGSSWDSKIRLTSRLQSVTAKSKATLCEFLVKGEQTSHQWVAKIALDATGKSLVFYGWLPSLPLKSYSGGHALS